MCPVTDVDIFDDSAMAPHGEPPVFLPPPADVVKHLTLGDLCEEIGGDLLENHRHEWLLHVHALIAHRFIDGEHKVQYIHENREMHEKAEKSALCKGNTFYLNFQRIEKAMCFKGTHTVNKHLHDDSERSTSLFQ